jgi:flagellar basal-body rod modification protein FlgD
MQISATGSTSSATSSANSSSRQSAGGAAQTVDYNQFLQLLIAEMKNQDPTKPMDPTQTVSQLASFSAVEQAVKTNSTLTSLLNQSALSQAGSFIGKTVTAADDSISGVVASVTTSSSGLTATLTDGTTIDLTTGISVS